MGLAEARRGILGGLPAAVRDIDNDAELVHLGHRRLAEVAEAAVMRLARAIADGVPPIVSQVHHADAQLVEDADEAQLIAGALPLLSQRHAIAGEAEAHMPGLLQGLDLLRAHHLGQRGLHQVGGAREVREALDQAQWVAALRLRFGRCR